MQSLYEMQYNTRSSATAEIARDAGVGALSLSLISRVYNVHLLNSSTSIKFTYVLIYQPDISVYVYRSICHLSSKCNWKKTAVSRWTCFGVRVAKNGLPNS